MAEEAYSIRNKGTNYITDNFEGKKIQNVAPIVSIQDAQRDALTKGTYINVAFSRDNLDSIEAGTKTTTVRAESQKNKIGLERGETSMIKVKGQTYLITYRGNLTVDEAGGIETMVKSEDLSTKETVDTPYAITVGKKTYYSKFQQTVDFMNGVKGLHVYDIRKAPKSELVSTRATYEGLISELKPNQVFVFGSNLEGLHGKGAAGVAFGKQQSVADISKVANDTKGKWAVKGIGEGLMEGLEGKSYAFPTVVYPGKKRSRTDAEIIESVSKLYQTARENPNLEFLVAYSNKPGLAGYTPVELGTFFASETAPSNVVFEKSFNLMAQPAEAKMISITQKDSDNIDNPC